MKKREKLVIISLGIALFSCINILYKNTQRENFVQNEKIYATLDEEIIDETDKINNTIDSSLETSNEDLNTTTEDNNTEIEFKLDSNMYLMSNYERQETEDNDFPRITRALEEIPEAAVLIFDEGEYDLAGSDIELTKSVKIKSENEAILKNGGFKLLSDNITIENIKIDAPNLDNGFEGHSCAISNIQIRNCSTNVKDHGFLFESYNGLVDNILIENCYAIDSVHGYVIKAQNVKVIGCHAKNNRSFGFALISDNMTGVNKKGQAILVVLERCIAENCGYGFRVYCRDKYKETSSLNNKNNIINNCISNMCTYPFQIGEASVPTGYKSVEPVRNCIISNIQAYKTKAAGKYSLIVNNAENCIFSNLILDKGYSVALADDVTRRSLGEMVDVTLSDVNLSENNILNIDGAIDKFNCTISEATENKITIEGTPLSGKEITIITNFTGEGASFGGFDENIFIIPEGILLSYAEGNSCQVTKWIYVESLNKWICSSLINTSI